MGLLLNSIGFVGPVIGLPISQFRGWPIQACIWLEWGSSGGTRALPGCQGAGDAGLSFVSVQGQFLSSLRDWFPFLELTQGLRPGLHSFAALRLGLFAADGS